MILKDKKILIGVTGSIAIYKTLDLIRLFIKSGAVVRVLMSESAKKFINPITFEAISQNKVLDENSENIELIHQRTSNNLQKGDVVLFHCKTLHHASKNHSDKAKISFVYTVRAKSNNPIKGTRSDFKEVILD